MDISISTNIFNRKDLTGNRLDLAKAGGFAVLDFNAYDYMDAPREGFGFLNPDWRGWIGRIRRDADQRGIRFNQTHNAVFNYFTADARQEINLACVDRIIEATAILGARITVCHPVAPPGAEYDCAASLKANREFFLRKADVAARFGVTLCLENMLSKRFFDGPLEKRYCTQMDELLALADAVNRENVQVCLDIGHLHYMGLKPETAIGLCGRRVAALHVHDNDSWSDQHLIPFSGTVNWTRTMAGLSDAGYLGDLTLETQGSFIRTADGLFPQQLRFARAVGEFLREEFQKNMDRPSGQKHEWRLSS